MRYKWNKDSAVLWIPKVFSSQETISVWSTVHPMQRIGQIMQQQKRRPYLQHREDRWWFSGKCWGCLADWSGERIWLADRCAFICLRIILLGAWEYFFLGASLSGIWVGVQWHFFKQKLDIWSFKKSSGNYQTKVRNYLFPRWMEASEVDYINCSQ